jgi:hypothetical protein
MRRILGSTFLVVGALSVLLSVLSLIAAAISLRERIKFGPGLMFADVEILAAIAFMLGSAGGVLLWLGRRLVRLNRPTGE